MSMSALTQCQPGSYAGVLPSYRQKQNRADGASDALDASWSLQLAARLGGQHILAHFRIATRRAWTAT
jgi:hypothetical protein